VKIVNVKIVNVMDVVVVPNKKAKQRKSERIKKNLHLKRHGRTKKQIARIKRKIRKR
jgi:hypothetical protein